MTTPVPAPDHSPEAEAALADAQWEAALNGKPLPDTPASTLEMVAAARLAMAELDPVRSPTDDEVAAAWRQVIRQHEGARSSPTVLDRLRQLFASPPVLASALAMGLAVGFAVVTWHQPADDEWSEVGRKGAPPIVAVPDADATAPAIVTELRALGLEPKLKATPAGTLVQVSWPAVSTDAQRQWLARYQLQATREGTLTLLLVKSTP